MTRRFSRLSSRRNDDNQRSRHESGQPAKQGVVDQMSYREPRFNWFHPFQSLKQRNRVYRHQVDLNDQFLDKDREAFQDRLDLNEAADRHQHRLDQRIKSKDDLVESQTRLTASMGIAETMFEVTVSECDLPPPSLLGHLSVPSSA